jgi:hypothetical protein
LRLVAGGWFVLREKYCWLVADKPSEQAARILLQERADGRAFWLFSDSIQSRRDNGYIKNHDIETRIYSESRFHFYSS